MRKLNWKLLSIFKIIFVRSARTNSISIRITPAMLSIIPSFLARLAQSRRFSVCDSQKRIWSVNEARPIFLCCSFHVEYVFACLSAVSFFYSAIAFNRSAQICTDYEYEYEYIYLFFCSTRNMPLAAEEEFCIDAMQEKHTNDARARAGQRGMRHNLQAKLVFWWQHSTVATMRIKHYDFYDEFSFTIFFIFRSAASHHNLFI